MNEYELRPSRYIENSERIYSDPTQFMSRFRSSDFYREAYVAFFEGKNVSPQATSEAKEIAFLQNSRGTLAMLDYYLSDKEFKFDLRVFPEDSQKALEDYISYVKTNLVKPSKDDVEERELRRSSFHMAAGNALSKDGVVPTVRAGRMFARIALVDLKIETVEQARAMH